MAYFLIFAVSLLLDQAVKYWAVVKLAPLSTMPIWQNVFHLTYAENKGAAFSMFHGARWFLIGIATVFLVLLAVLLRKNYFTTWWSKVGAALLAAGALGNVIDRVRLGHVVDLFDFRGINFAIFNVADVCITLGGILVAIYMIFIEGKNA